LASGLTLEPPGQRDIEGWKTEANINENVCEEQQTNLSFCQYVEDIFRIPAKI